MVLWDIKSAVQLHVVALPQLQLLYHVLRLTISHLRVHLFKCYACISPTVADATRPEQHSTFNARLCPVTASAELRLTSRHRTREHRCSPSFCTAEFKVRSYSGSSPRRKIFTVVVGVVQRGEPRGYGLGAKCKSRLAAASMCEDSSLPELPLEYLHPCSVPGLKRF